ncbi:helix-turn-helix domain-containing protein [Priestia endophytica]|uniref:helix-turn-helix domain-containing protein n=1 Tax=Priestia endophytica TaxID=135735 RepID=UPI00124DF3A2|nr:helix-turn-helix domain-containing protein [Priestia endophytica]KAB2495596.1 hypothetical protein F8155_06360 [Priestia endophytica]
MDAQVVVKLVEELKGDISVQQICQHLEVPRSTYYRWKNKRVDPLQKNIEQKVGKLCHQFKFRYGYRKITA